MVNLLFRICIIILVISAQAYAVDADQPDTAVKMTTALDNTFICPNKKEAYLYLNINGCSSFGKRVPLNISVVFDRSGSMEGERMHYGKRAIEYLIEHLEPDDIMSLVVYDHEAFVLHGSTPVVDRNALIKKLHRIFARGATNMMAGLELGVQEVVSTYDKNKINRVLLFSDGQPNEGITDPFIMDRIFSDYAHKYDISISTFGLGHEFNEFMMHDIAEAGAGNYYYIKSPIDIVNDISIEVEKLNNVVAQNAILIIDYPYSYLTVSRVYGHPYKMLRGQIYIDMSEIHPDESNGVLIKFIINTQPSATINFTSRISYFSCLTLSTVAIEKINVLTISNDAEGCSQQYNTAVLEQMIYYSSHYLLESAIKDADSENYNGAKQKVQQARQVISQSPVPPGYSPLLTDQQAIINQYDTHLTTAHLKSDHDRKHMQKKIHYTNYQLRKRKT